MEPEALKVMVQADLERSLEQYKKGMLFQVKEAEDLIRDKGIR